MSFMNIFMFSAYFLKLTYYLLHAVRLMNCMFTEIATHHLQRYDYCATGLQFSLGDLQAMAYY